MNSSAGHASLFQAPSVSVRDENTERGFPAPMETAAGKYGGFSQQPCHRIHPGAGVVSGVGLVNTASAALGDGPSPSRLSSTSASSRESLLSEAWLREGGSDRSSDGDGDRGWSSMQLPSNPVSPLSLSRMVSPCSSVRSGMFTPTVVRVRSNSLASGSSLLGLAQASITSSWESLSSSMDPQSPPTQRRRPPVTRLSLLTAILRKGRLPVLSPALRRPYSPCWPVNSVTRTTCSACSAACRVASIPLEVSTSRALLPLASMPAMGGPTRNHQVKRDNWHSNRSPTSPLTVRFEETPNRSPQTKRGNQGNWDPIRCPTSPVTVHFRKTPNASPQTKQGNQGNQGKWDFNRCTTSPLTVHFEETSNTSPQTKHTTCEPTFVGRIRSPWGLHAEGGPEDAMGRASSPRGLQSPTPILKPMTLSFPSDRTISEGPESNQVHRSPASWSQFHSPSKLKPASYQIIRESRGCAVVDCQSVAALPVAWSPVALSPVTLSPEPIDLVRSPALRKWSPLPSFPDGHLAGLRARPPPSCWTRTPPSTALHLSPTITVSKVPKLSETPSTPPPPPAPCWQGTHPVSTSNRMPPIFKVHRLSSSRYTPIIFPGWPSPSSSPTPPTLSPSPSSTPTIWDPPPPSPSPGPSLSPSLCPTPSPRLCADREDRRRKPHKIKSSYKSLAAIPTNTLLMEQQVIDDQVEEDSREMSDRCLTDTHLE